MPELNVELSQNQVNYPLKIKRGLLNQLGEDISAIFKGERIAILTDETVNHYYGKTVKKELEEYGYQVLLIVLPSGEQTKSFDRMSVIYSELLEFELSRSDLILSFGGGVIGDIAGFVAATFLRGIQFVQIPTTLLAQVDSSIGGKVGVDLPEGKNLAGAFYHPSLVIIDPVVLKTLTDQAFADGMAEVIKYGCINDRLFFDFLLSCQTREEIMVHIETIIEKCCTLKSEIVQKDEKDTGERMLLNFGHTLGHAIEAYYQYEEYSHGQAVAIGMVKITELAEEKGITPGGTARRIEGCLKQHHLPIELKRPEDYPKILPFIKNDKKNMNNDLHVIVLDELGNARQKKTNFQFFDVLQKGGQTS